MIACVYSFSNQLIYKALKRRSTSAVSLPSFSNQLIYKALKLMISYLCQYFCFSNQLIYKALKHYSNFLSVCQCFSNQLIYKALKPQIRYLRFSPSHSYWHTCKLYNWIKHQSLSIKVWLSSAILSIYRLSKSRKIAFSFCIS